MSFQLNNARANLERLKSSLTLSQADTSAIEEALDRLDMAERWIEHVSLGHFRQHDAPRLDSVVRLGKSEG